MVHTNFPDSRTFPMQWSRIAVKAALLRVLDQQSHGLGGCSKKKAKNPPRKSDDFWAPRHSGTKSVRQVSFYSPFHRSTRRLHTGCASNTLQTGCANVSLRTSTMLPLDALISPRHAPNRTWPMGFPCYFLDVSL